jgi:hypothetical protein
MTTSSKATQEQLEALHGALAAELKKRITEGSATAADLAVALKLLKDNHIEVIPAPNSPIDDLRQSLPFATPAGVRAEEEDMRH